MLRGELTTSHRKTLRNEIWGSHDGESVDVGLVGYNAEDGGSMFLQNVGVYVQIHMGLQP
jgi:hypothetical protein